MQRIVICDPSDATRDPLRSLLLGVDFVFLDAECKRYEAFESLIQDSPPDIAVINLDADKAKSLLLVSGLSQSYPQIPLLVISSDNQAILQSLQSGAKHFLTQPVVLEDLLRVLRRIEGESGVAQTTPGMVQRSQGCTVISILGSRGGVGCTAMAVNLACSIAADPEAAVALMDLDLALGDTDVALDMMADHTLYDLAMNIDKLDLNYLKRSLSRHAPSNISLLAHPMQMTDIGVIQAPHVERIINLLRMSYTHLVIDLSKGLTPVDVTALEQSDVVLLMAQLELSSLRNVVRMLLSLDGQDGLKDKVRVVMNRVGAEHSDEQISLKKAEETIGMPIFWQIPNDAKAMLGSRTAGEPLVQHAPKSRAHQSITALAATLCNKPAEPVGTGKDPGSGGFLRGIFGKK